MISAPLARPAFISLYRAAARTDQR